METSIEQQIRDYIQENFLFGKPIDFGDQDSFLELGVIDSTGVLELVAFVQETFNFAIEDEEMLPEYLDSIRNLTNFISSKISNDATAKLG